jgi:hypothetical protein
MRSLSSLNDGRGFGAHGFEVLNIASTLGYGTTLQGAVRMQSAQGPTLLTITGESMLMAFGPIRADRIDASGHSGGFFMYAAAEIPARIIGSPSRDSIIVHEGDTVTGGAGGDGFHVAAGTRFARITDFTVVDDVISVTAPARLELAAPRALFSANDIASVRAFMAAAAPAVGVVNVGTGAVAGTYLYVGGPTDLLLEITGVQGTLTIDDISFSIRAQPPY